MLVQTIRGCIGLGVLLALGPLSLQAKDAPGSASAASITVSVYDDAKVGLDAMLLAEETATFVFQRAGIAVHWLNCIVGGKIAYPQGPCGKAVFPTNLQIRIVRKSRNLSPGTLGISYLSTEGIGCYSEVFLEPAEVLSKTFPVATATLLGDAAAHEIAHLLLGTKSHTATGIMRARWQREDLVAAGQGSMHFDLPEAEKMREQLAGTAVARAGVGLVATRLGGEW
jgi:hypothetical protein